MGVAESFGVVLLLSSDIMDIVLVPASLVSVRLSACGSSKGGSGSGRMAALGSFPPSSS